MPTHALDPPPKAIVFDLMGTCCDWKTAIVAELHRAASETSTSDIAPDDLAIQWREGFFDEIHRRFREDLPGEDIDVTHRRVLDRILDAGGLGDWGEAVRQRLVAAWHFQVAWPGVVEAIERLKKRFMVVVLANGTTRFQLDVIRSSGLNFHSLFSSQLLGLTKPDPAIYLKLTELLDVEPRDCVMVAAHAYDLYAAKQVGFQTVYIQRSTEDVHENMRVIKENVDVFLGEKDTDSSTEALARLADLLGV